jgi:hypothetical protein
MHKHPDENTARVVALALAFFGGLALAALAAGVFDRLGTELTLMLAGFAASFAALTYHLDPAVRGFVKKLFAPRVAARKARGRPAAV